MICLRAIRGSFLILGFCLLPVAVIGQARIVSLVVRGNKTLNRESIISSSGLKLGDSATPAALYAAQESLLASGYYGMRRVDDQQDGVKIAVTDVDQATNQGTVVIQVEENDVVQGFNITGNGPIPPKDVQAQMQTKPGFVLNIKTLRADVERIQKYYDSKGYLATVAEDGFGATNGILDIPIIVGKVGTLKVSQCGKVRKKVKWAREELSRVLKPGDYYNSIVFRAVCARLKRKGIDLRCSLDDVVVCGSPAPAPISQILLEPVPSGRK